MEVIKVIFLFSVSVACAFCNEAINERRGLVANDGRCSSCVSPGPKSVAAHLRQGSVVIPRTYGRMNNLLNSLAESNDHINAPTGALNQQQVLYDQLGQNTQDGLFEQPDQLDKKATINAFTIHNVEGLNIHTRNNDLPSESGVQQSSQEVLDASSEQSLHNILKQNSNYLSGNVYSQLLNGLQHNDNYISGNVDSPLLYQLQHGGNYINENVDSQLLNGLQHNDNYIRGNVYDQLPKGLQYGTNYIPGNVNSQRLVELQQSGNYISGNVDSQLIRELQKTRNIISGSADNVLLDSLKSERQAHSLVGPIRPVLNCVSGICKVCIYCSWGDCQKYLSYANNYASTLPSYLQNAKDGNIHKPLWLNLPPKDETLSVENILNQYPRENRGRYNVVNLPDIVGNQIVGGGTSLRLPSAMSVRERGRLNPYSPLFIASNSVPNRPVTRFDDRRSKNMDTADIVRKVITIPSQVIRDSAKNFLSIVPGLDNFRRSNQINDGVISGEANNVIVPENDIDTKILGGNHATSSGTPMQIKARLGD